MARDYYFGFDLTRLGGFSATISSAVTINTGTYAHVDISSVATGFSDFATALAAASTGTTVTFDVTNLTYTLTRGAAFTLTFPNTTAGNNAADILGFARNTSYTGATSYTSVARPYYVLRGKIDGQASESDEYEPSGISVDGEADDGTAYGISRLRAPVYLDWLQRFEEPTPPVTIAGAGQAIFERDATALVPWSWQAAHKHARNAMPFILRAPTPVTGPVVKLRADGAQFAPQRVVSDYQGLWDIPIKSRLMGRVTVAAPPARSIAVAESLSNVNFWQLAGSAALNGSTTMTIGVIYRAESTALARNISFFRKWSGGLRGYAARGLNSTTRVTGLCVNTAPSNISKISTTVPMATGNFYTFVMRLNTAVGIDVFFQGVKDGSPVACATYSPATTSDTIQLGIAESAGACLVGIAAVVIAESTAVSDANVTSWHSQVAASNTWTFPGGGTTHVYYAGDISGTNWTSQITGVTLTSSGSPTTASYSSPVFP